ncbi:MAG: TIGR02391 family protein [Bacteroidetes bacterium]|nr:TIGR02391 family protein [Bacteroidota bacterium]
MTRWIYICTSLAKNFATLGLGGYYTKTHIAQCWISLYDFRPENYSDENIMPHESLRAMFNCFMTLANLKNQTEEEKARNILLLLKTITGGYKQEFIEEVFKDAGYVGEVPKLLSPDRIKADNMFHSEVEKHARKYFAQGHFSNCVNEVCKAFNKAVQVKSGSTKDGQDLMFTVFGKDGNLRINEYKTESEINEQEGYKFLAGGLMRGFRNPTAHETSSAWMYSEQDCVAILSLASFLFRGLDKSNRV